MAGLDVTEKALIFPEDFERIRALGNPVALVVAQWLEFFYEFHREIGYEGRHQRDRIHLLHRVSRFRQLRAVKAGFPMHRCRCHPEIRPNYARKHVYITYDDTTQDSACGSVKKTEGFWNEENTC